MSEDIIQSKNHIKIFDWKSLFFYCIFLNHEKNSPAHNILVLPALYIPGQFLINEFLRYATIR